MISDGRKALYDGCDSRGHPIKRPMSPHLSVYRTRLSMVLSISNRIAGVFSALGTGLAVAWLGALVQGPAPFARAQRITRHPAGQIVLAGWSIATLYHLIAGVRHLIWDRGARFEKRQIMADGRASVGITIGAATALIGAFAWLSQHRGKGSAS